MTVMEGQQMSRFGKTLESFQHRGSLHLQNHYHAMLADEPGLGKTVQAVHAAMALGARRALVVCPASVRTHWRDEIEECGGWANDMNWDVYGYEEAVDKFRHGTSETWDVFIPDEAHYLKNLESQRTRALLGNTGVARRCGAKWPLTGTPVLGRPLELYPILKTLHPEFARDTFASFAQRYCGAFFDGRGMNNRGATNLDELRVRLEGFMLRRTADEVGLELPPIVSSVVPLELDAASKAMIDEVERDIVDREAFVSTVMEDFSALGDQATLLHAVGLAKAAPAARYVVDLLETEEKVVVFAHHRDVVETIRAVLWQNKIASWPYTGGLSDHDKDQMKQAFVEHQGPCALVGNIKAMGTGVDGLQQVARTCVFAELTWVPDELGQCIRRLRRMGQRADKVNAHVLYAPGTAEGAVFGVHRRKTAVTERLGLGSGWRH